MTRALLALLATSLACAPARTDSAAPLVAPHEAPEEVAKAADPPPAASATPVPPTIAGADPALNRQYADPQRTDRWDRVFTDENREVAARRSDILQDMSVPPGAVVADVGAGTGLFTLELARAVGESGRVYAVDIVPHFLRRIDERARAAGLANVTTVQATQRSPGLAPASVDLVLLCDAYHHLEEPAAVLAELRRALRPGGTLVLIDLNREPGRSPDWMLRHVRAGKAEVLAELQSAGFALVDDRTAALGLRDNYVLRLRVLP